MIDLFVFILAFNKIYFPYYGIIKRDKMMSQTFIWRWNMAWIYFMLTALGLVIIVVGSAVKRKGKTSFIAGYNEVFVPKDEKKLAGQIGFVMMLFGVETICFPLVFQFLKGIEGYHFALLAGLHILAVLILMLVDQMNG